MNEVKIKEKEKEDESMTEEDYYSIGEGLAKTAVENGVGSNQLQDLYRFAKTKPLPFMEAHVNRQTARAIKSRGGSPRGFDVFGPEFLDVIDKFRRDKQSLRKVLFYANMLYDYEDVKSKRVGEGWTEKIGAIVNEVCNDYGIRGLTLTKERGGMLCNLKLSRFRGNPKRLADTLTAKVESEYPELEGSIRFWIDF